VPATTFDPSGLNDAEEAPELRAYIGGVPLEFAHVLIASTLPGHVLCLLGLQLGHVEVKRVDVGDACATGSVLRAAPQKAAFFGTASRRPSARWATRPRPEVAPARAHHCVHAEGHSRGHRLGRRTPPVNPRGPTPGPTWSWNQALSRSRIPRSKPHGQKHRRRCYESDHRSDQGLAAGSRCHEHHVARVYACAHAYEGRTCRPDSLIMRKRGAERRRSRTR
jgi:hypothetical protein